MEIKISKEAKELSKSSIISPKDMQYMLDCKMTKKDINAVDHLIHRTGKDLYTVLEFLGFRIQWF